MKAKSKYGWLSAIAVLNWKLTDWQECETNVCQFYHQDSVILKIEEWKGNI